MIPEDKQKLEALQKTVRNQGIALDAFDQREMETSEENRHLQARIEQLEGLLSRANDALIDTERYSGSLFHSRIEKALGGANE